MEKRLPLAGAALALIALPLAYQLHSTTNGGARVESAADREAPAPVPQSLAPPSQPAPKPAQLALRKEMAARAAPPAPAPAPPVAAVAAMEPGGRSLCRAGGGAGGCRHGTEQGRGSHDRACR